ncbi:MAG: uroporphyrinogen-III synthase [Gemmatimonadota bacterium]
MYLGRKGEARPRAEPVGRPGLTVRPGSPSETLRDLRVAVTRARSGSSEDRLSVLLRARGARPLHYALTRTLPATDPPGLHAAVSGFFDFDWVVVTSARTVEPLSEALSSAGISPAGIGASSLRICAVGPATAAALREAGFPVHLVPDRFRAEGIVAALREEGGGRGLRILFPRAEEGSDTIPGELSEAGFSVEVVTAYETAPDEAEAARLGADVAAGKIDLLTFTAGSAARSFAASWGARRSLPPGVGVVAIGPATAGALERLGIPPQEIADPHTLEGVVAGAERWARARTQGP